MHRHCPSVRTFWRAFILAMVLALCGTLSACGASSDSAEPAQYVPIVELEEDTGERVPAPDSALPPFEEDSGTPDGQQDVAPPPAATAFGSISGACERLAGALGTGDPSLWSNTFEFDNDPFEPADLSPAAQILFDSPNAGGSSLCSEVFSLELLHACLGAELYKSETEIHYDGAGAMTDYAVDIADLRIGVSVTRAYKGPFVNTYTLEDAVELLNKKLAGVNESSQLVAVEDGWSQQILHIWTLHPDWAATVAEAWDGLDPGLTADTLVLITVETASEMVVTNSCSP